MELLRVEMWTEISKVFLMVEKWWVRAMELLRVEMWTEISKVFLMVEKWLVGEMGLVMERVRVAKYSEYGKEHWMAENSLDCMTVQMKVWKWMG